jgi:hypothetical protein
MHKASNALSVLQATAAIVGMAILLWSFGLPSLRFAEAANVTSYSDVLSDSAPTAASDHEIKFTSPTGIANGQAIVLDFSDGPFVLGSVDFTDIDVSTSTPLTVAATCGATDHVGADVGSWPLLTLTFCSGDTAYLAANGTTTIKIGFNATGGNARLTNPAVGSHEIPLTAGASDTGETRVAIVQNVQVTATVDTLFTFSVTGVAAGQTVNGTTTGAVTTPTLIPFGKMQANVASTAAQDLTVVTNARNGFAVTVETDQQLTSINGADIDGFSNGAYTSSAIPWANPTATPGDEDTYGHWGITSNDPTLTQSLTDEFDVAGNGQDYVSASTSPVEVFRHDGPTTGATTGVGTTRVGYTAKISALQEAAEDYNATLTYIATPVF